MEVTYMLIVSVVAYILGAVDRLFMETIPNRFIPIQNVIVGIISGIVCYFADIETNLFNSIIVFISSCFFSSFDITITYLFKISIISS